MQPHQYKYGNNSGYSSYENYLENILEVTQSYIDNIDKHYENGLQLFYDMVYGFLGAYGEDIQAEEILENIIEKEYSHHNIYKAIVIAEKLGFLMVHNKTNDEELNKIKYLIELEIKEINND